MLDQMDFRRQQAEKEGYAEFVKDKAQIDEIMRKVAAEDEQEQVERRERAALSRKFARDAMVERQKFLEAETRRQEQVPLVPGQLFFLIRLFFSQALLLASSASLPNFAFPE